MFEVKPAQGRDALRVPEVLDPGLQCALERHEPHEGKRRQQDEREGVERGADVGGRGDEAKRDEAAAHRGQEHRRPAGGLRDRRRARTLQGEVLGRDEGHRRGRRSVAGRARCGCCDELVDGRRLLRDDGRVGVDDGHVGSSLRR
jgi:hypothetical protein